MLDYEALLARHGEEGLRCIYFSYNSSGALQSAAISPETVPTVLAPGATVLLLHADRGHARLRELCREIEFDLGLAPNTCDAHYHISTRGGGFLHPHTDEYEILSLQLAGTKHWVVGGEAMAPLAHETFLDQATNVSIHRGGRRDLIPDVAHEIEMRAGSVLLLPRQCVHITESRDEAPSLHLSFGIRTPRVADVILDAVARLLETHKGSSSPVYRGDGPSDELVEAAIDLVKSRLTAAPASYEAEVLAHELSFAARYTDSFLKKVEHARLRGFTVV